MRNKIVLGTLIAIGLVGFVLLDHAALQPKSLATQQDAFNLQPDVEPAGPRRPHVAPRAGETLTMSIKGLGNFDYASDGGSIPADVLQLSGASIRLRGYMVPLDQSNELTRFTLVPDRFSCCFGQPPALQHIVLVECAAGKAASYCPGEIVVEGTLSVGEVRENSYIIGIFRVQCTSIKPIGS